MVWTIQTQQVEAQISTLAEVTTFDTNMISTHEVNMISTHEVDPSDVNTISTRSIKP